MSFVIVVRSQVKSHINTLYTDLFFHLLLEVVERGGGAMCGLYKIGIIYACALVVYMRKRLVMYMCDQRSLPHNYSRSIYSHRQRARTHTDSI